MTYHSSKRIFYYPPRRHTTKTIILSSAIDGFLLACQARRLSVHTISDYRRTMVKFLAHVGDAPLAEITSAQVTAFLAAQPHSEKTVLNYHIGLSALWTWAIREGYASVHTIRNIAKPSPKVVAVEPFTEVEVRAMLASVRRNSDRDKAIIMLLLDTGLRASELCGLSLHDIDLVGSKVKIAHGKGNKERVIPIGQRTTAALFRYLSATKPLVPFPFTRTSLAHLIRKIGQRAGIHDAHPHRFRHTFAINYLRNGGDALTLQEILGHSTMEMVKTYVKLASVDIEQAHRRASPADNWRL